MTKRKFYKTTFTVTVLHEEQGYFPDDLSDIQQDITDGPCSGNMEQNETVELNGKQAAKELRKQASDPSFFFIDDEGNDIDENAGKE